MNLWGEAAMLVGSVTGTAFAAMFAARATRAAADVTAQAQRQAAETTAGPDGRRVDLSVLQASVSRLDEENAELRRRQFRMETLIRAFSRYVSELTGQMRQHGIEPPLPPDPVEEYNRTGA